MKCKGLSCLGRRELGCAFASFDETMETGLQVLLSRRRDGTLDRPLTRVPEPQLYISGCELSQIQCFCTLQCSCLCRFSGLFQLRS